MVLNHNWEQREFHGKAFVNNEFNHVFAVTLRQELPRHAYRLQAEEVDDVKHIALSELGALLREGDEKHVTYLAGLGRQGGALENAKVSLGKGGGEGHCKSAPRGREGMTQRQILPTPGGRGGGPGLGRAAFGGVRAQPLGARSPGRTAPDPPPRRTRTRPCLRANALPSWGAYFSFQADPANTCLP